MSRLPRDVVVATAIIASMSIVAAFGFRGVFPGWSFVPAAAVGAVGAALVAVIARWFRLSVPEALLASLVGFVALGAVAVNGVPSSGAYGSFFDGLVNGWAEILSSTPPAEVTAEFRVLPFSVAWFGTMIGAELLRSRRTPGLAAIGPVVALALCLLVTLEDRAVAIAQGAGIVVGTLVLGFLQQRARTRQAEIFEDMTIDEPSRTAGLIPASIAVVVVAVAAPLLGPRLPLAEANDRFDLRELQTPPFDPLEHPSPLVQVKAHFQEVNADKVIFRVTSDDQLQRFPLAILDHYTSEVWAIADEAGAAARFRPVDSVFPPPASATIDDWPQVDVTIEIGELRAIAQGEFDPAWLPTPGWPVEVTSEERLDLRFDSESGTVAVAPDGPDTGLVYTVTAAVPPAVEDLRLRSAAVTTVSPLDLAAPGILAFAGDVLEGADVGWEQVEAIRSRLVDGGAYDSRQNSQDARPGHSRGRIRDFLAEPDRIVGYEEQYAATAALLARSEGLPARVVVGYLVPDDELEARWVDGTLDVVANDVSAWIEVRFDEIGWIPFDVTPPRDREPEDTTTGRSQREVAVPNPPPDPPPPELPPELDRDAEVEEEEPPEDEPVDAGGGGIPVRTIAIAVAASSPMLLLIAAVVAVIMLKNRRTRRRRSAGTPSHRVAGAWHELVDRCEELGAKPRASATPREFARGLRAAALVGDDEGDLLLQLADDVSVAAYHPSPASDDSARVAWEKSDVLVDTISRSRTLPRRIRQRVDPRPLMRRDPLLDRGET